ncbi:MAG: ATP-dependent protease subunit HslV, partial [Betaproteobacteria bacterium AqS2]|nr:ATP-dependent protease subunit HslV [Betaproteobacteria bacterium AqS2]
MESDERPRLRATTIVCARRGGKVALGGDGQVTFGETIIGKSTATKVQELVKGEVVAGMAGETSDCMTLLHKLKENLRANSNNLHQAVASFARAWNTDKMFRQFNAQLLLADREETFLVSGTGTVIEPEHDVIAIGSGAPYALAAARALSDNTKLGAEEIVKRSLDIAADICVYT